MSSSIDQNFLRLFTLFYLSRYDSIKQIQLLLFSSNGDNEEKLYVFYVFVVFLLNLWLAVISSKYADY